MSNQIKREADGTISHRWYDEDGFNNQDYMRWVIGPEREKYAVDTQGDGIEAHMPQYGDLLRANFDYYVAWNTQPQAVTYEELMTAVICGEAAMVKL